MGKLSAACIKEFWIGLESIEWDSFQDFRVTIGFEQLAVHKKPNLKYIRIFESPSLHDGTPLKTKWINSKRVFATDYWFSFCRTKKKFSVMRRNSSKNQKYGKMPPIVSEWLDFFFWIVFYVLKAYF
jgi:hypothetical protein